MSSPGGCSLSRDRGPALTQMSSQIAMARHLADPDPARTISDAEEPLLVEHAVIGQVVLGVVRHDPSAVQYSRGVVTPAVGGIGRCGARCPTTTAIVVRPAASRSPARVCRDCRHARWKLGRRAGPPPGIR